MKKLFPQASPWFEVLKRRSSVRLRLFCFPFAGGGSSAYRSWIPLLPDEVELIACQLPGRESRVSENYILEGSQVTEALQREIRPYLDLPFVFFGHSMGGHICFELARALQRDGGAENLKRIIVSACNPPHRRDEREYIGNLPEEEFIQRLKLLDGTPDEFFEMPELMEIFIPILRADFCLAESYMQQDAAPLPVALDAYAGTGDSISLDHMAEWNRYTEVDFSFKAFSGKHFFINSHRIEVLHTIRNTLGTHM